MRRTRDGFQRQVTALTAAQPGVACRVPRGVVPRVRSAAALAEVSVLRCEFNGGFSAFFTHYSDGTPARIGTAPGVGDRAHAIHDRAPILGFLLI
jgi:hypothetical protein